MPRDLPPTTRHFPVGQVLVVDDEPLIRWSIAETLADRGYAVVEAGNGREAIGALLDSKIAFDVVVLDFRLPDSSDLGLLSRIRAERAEVPVILMTAFGTSELVQDALTLGAYRVVSKPFEVYDLAALVSQAHGHSDN
jgi:DNA-binding NtrC family response regulator